MPTSDRPCPLVSFVIPVRNDAAQLARCLTSIANVRYPLSRVEVIVVDNGSTDRTPDVARTLGARVLSLPGLAVAALRNCGAREARGEIIAFVDADHEIGEAWVDSAVETIQRQGAAAAGAPYDAPPQSTWVQAHYDKLRYRRAGVEDVDWLASGNIANNLASMVMREPAMAPESATQVSACARGTCGVNG